MCTSESQLALEWAYLQVGLMSLKHGRYFNFVPCQRIRHGNSG